MIEFNSILDDNFFAVPSLKTVEEYDLNKSEKEVRKIIQHFIDLQIEYNKILPPRITRNYELVYSNNKNISTSDNVGNFVVSKISKEEEIIKFYDIIYCALTKLNKEEMIYFVESLYCGKSDLKIADELLLSKYQIKNMKQSCVIKLAKSFKVAVKKATKTSQNKKVKEVEI